MSRFTFFRQSGWITLSSGLTGVLFAAVHKTASAMGRPEYSVFATMLLVLSQTSIPAVALQLTFAQQTVQDLNAGRRAELASALRALTFFALGLWLFACIALWLFQERLLSDYKINNPVTLWLTLTAALASLFNPMFLGVLQGQQNFFWFGWANIFNALTRAATVSLLVLAFGGQAAGAMLGVLLGLLVSTVTAVWQIRALWKGPYVRFTWGPWFKRVLPITLAMGAITYMLTLDGIVVQRFFEPAQTSFYQAAGIIGRAVFFFTAPMTWVLFPKLVQSAARAEKTTVLAQVLGATCLLGGGMAMVCTFFPTLPLRILYSPAFFEIAPLVPVFGWCVLPLSLATVLVNNLLARQRATIPFVSSVVLVAAGYGVTLYQRHASFEQVIHTLGFFSLLLFTVCVGFTWWGARTTTPQQTRSAGENAGGLL